MPKQKKPARDPGVLIRDVKPETLDAAQKEAEARGVSRSDVLKEWLDAAAGAVCPACKGTGRKR